MKKRTDLLTYIAVILLTIVFIVVGNRITEFTPTQQYDEGYYSAKIEQIDDVVDESYTIEGLEDQIEVTIVEFSAKILEGERKGEIVSVTQRLDELMLTKQDPVQPNDKIMIYEQAQLGGELAFVFTDYLRTDNLALLVIAFLALIIIFGKTKGVNTVISLVATCLILFAVFIPGILKGYNVYLLTTIVSTYIIFMNLILINGLSKKTWCAIIGNLGGLIAAGVITLFMTDQLMLTGFVDSDSGILVNVNPGAPLDLVAIAWSSVLIGSLGAIMDIAMTISSALQEVYENSQERNFKQLFESGMNIGRDAVGTMTNTLILAYIGSSLTTVLLLVSSNKNLMSLFNLEMITLEVLQGVVGSIGILLAIPLTSAISAYLYSKE